MESEREEIKEKSPGMLEWSRYREASEVLARAFCDDPLLISILRGLNAEKRLGRLKLVFELTLKTLGPVSYTHLTLPTNREV